MKLLFLILNILILSCQTMGTNSILPNDLLTNRASLEFEALGVRYTGTAVLPQKLGAGLDIKFYLPQDTILLQLDNCAREHIAIKPKERFYLYNYKPSMLKEARNSCIMQVQATTNKGEFKLAIIEWQDLGSLKTKLWCNEAQEQAYQGVAICQNRSGKLMWLDFDDEVVFVTPEKCNTPVKEAQTFSKESYSVTVSKGICPYIFMDSKRNKLRLTTYGYTAIQEINLESERIK